MGDSSPKNGFLGALRKVRAAKTLLDAANVNYGVKDRGHMITAATAGVRLNYALNSGFLESENGSISDIYGSFWEDLSKAITEIDSLQNVADLRRSRVKAMVQDALRLKDQGKAGSDESTKKEEVMYM